MTGSGNIISLAYYHSYGQSLNGVYTNNNLRTINTPNTSDVIKVQPNLNTTVYLKSNGDLYFAGYNGYYQFGDNTNTNKTSPTLLTTNVIDFYLGEKHLLI